MNQNDRAEYRLRVLNVVIANPYEHVGGAERAGLQFGDALSSYVDADIVKMQGEYDESLFRDLDMEAEVHPIPSYTILRDVLEGVVTSSNNIWNVLIATRLTPPVSLQKYDFVHIHNAVPLAGLVGAALHSRLAGVPYCITTHGISKIPEIPDELNLSGVEKRLFEFGFLKPYLTVLRNASHLFALSEIDKRELQSRFPEQSVSILRNGVVPIDEQEPTSASRSSPIESPKKPLLLFVGRIMESKGIDDLLTAFEKVATDCKLAIVGPLRDSSYRSQMDEMGEDVEYLGYISQEKLNLLYQEADLFVFPTRSDVFPLVTLEAMAAKTPVISTTVGGLPEQITDCAGVLVPPNDPAAVANAIDEILGDEQTRQRMARSAFEDVQERYSWDAIAREAAAEYQSISNEKQR